MKQKIELIIFIILLVFLVYALIAGAQLQDQQQQKKEAQLSAWMNQCVAKHGTIQKITTGSFWSTTGDYEQHLICNLPK